MKYRARCSTRQQHRKTIKGVYDPNDRLPCHVPGCPGLMREDITREREGFKDSGSKELCRCDGLEMSIRNAPHLKGTKGCKYHDEVVTKRNLSPRSKHSPIPADEWVPF